MKNIKYGAFLLFLLVVLVAFLLPGVLFPGDILRNIPSFSLNGWIRPQNSLLADPVFQFEPWRYYAKQQVEQGTIPLWNDKNGSGVPFLALSHGALLFPLTFLYYFLPLHLGLNLMLLLKFYFYGLFMFLYLRVLRCSIIVSVIGALATAFSAFSIVWALWPQTNVMLLFPLLLYATEQLQHTRKKYRWYLLLSLTYFFAILGGHPETTFHIGIIHGFYTVVVYWRKKYLIIPIFASVIGGFLLASFHIFPFIEYVLNSYILYDRSVQLKDFYIPPVGFLANFVPFLMGAPHLEQYKPLSNTNFQEMIGGYVGPSILLFALIFALGRYRNILVRFWMIVVVSSWVIAYKIWPFYLVSLLPVFRTSANHRLVAFAGFGLLVIFSLGLESLRNKEIRISKHMWRGICIGGSICITLTILGVFMLHNINSEKTIKQFLPFLQWHLLFMEFSTWLFFGLLFWLSFKGKSTKLYLFLIIPILLQSIFLFWTYNPLTGKKDYYPETSLTETLRHLPEGKVLEVGNPALPPSVNLIYNIDNVVNNDAIEIASYRKAFDKAFPLKNQWGNVETVEYENLKRFGITYVVSDFDVRLQRDKRYASYDKILPAITSDHTLQRLFRPKSSSLKQIRVLTANFNRLNTCHLVFTIYRSGDPVPLSTQNIDCKNIRDFMFYTIDLPQVTLEENQEYTLRVTSTDSHEGNAVALWGINGEPYVELLYEQSLTSEDHYNLLFHTESLFLLRVKDAQMLSLDGSYTVLNENAGRKIFELLLSHQSLVEIKQAYYPGWVAKVDGNTIPTENNNPFLAVHVPQGRHIVEIIYRPLSLILGLFISFLAMLGLGILTVRGEKNATWAKYIDKKWTILMLGVNKMSWWTHSVIITLGLICSVTILLVVLSHMPVNFSFPQTTAINWFTVHRYQRQQDYFYFLFCTIFIYVLTILFWLVWITLTKKRK